jgi:branched-subunit amino acid aminotransferase/4-amino-4-deoxychorismate lyase
MQAKPFTCLNGHFVLAHRAAVAVADRGFRFGDGVFETIRVERGAPYQWAAHMERLLAGLVALSIAPPVDDFAPYAQQLLKKNKAKAGYIRLAISRGAGSRGYAPFPPSMPCSWVMEWLDGLSEPTAPCRLYLSARPRIPPQCLPTHAKLAQGINSTLALMEAQENDRDDALQLSIQGFLSEASSANLFWLKQGMLFTPALETGCLAGTTRAAILRLSPLPVRLVSDGLSELEHAEAVFLTNSRVGVWPVASLAPMGWVWSPTHPIHRDMLGLLIEDRKRARWGQA